MSPEAPKTRPHRRDGPCTAFNKELTVAEQQVPAVGPRPETSGWSHFVCQQALGPLLGDQVVDQTND